MREGELAKKVLQSIGHRAQSFRALSHVSNSQSPSRPLKERGKAMRLKKGDILIVVILLISLLAWFGAKLIWQETGSRTLEIQVDGKVYKSISLDSVKEEQQLEIDLQDDNFIKITYGPEGVIVKEGDVTCPNEVCVKTGLISEVGESIVCLPNRVIAYIDGGNKGNKVDEISY